jgi:hypothetical protein
MTARDGHTGISAEAGGTPGPGFQRGLLRGMWWTTRDRSGATASRFFGAGYGWHWHRGCAVSIEAGDVSLSGVASHEAAIARVEQHLHGHHDVKAPADPLCQRPTEP